MPDDFRPSASWPVLQLRARMLQQLRQFFESRGFLEVETPLLSRDTVVDRHLSPLSVARGEGPGRRHTMWLQTSPEFAMKRLLAAGGQALYQISKAFRGGERGQLHNPEFTIVEWYRVGQTMQQGMQLLSELAEQFLERGAAEQLSYRQAFQRHAGCDPLRAATDEFRQAAGRHGLTVPAGELDADAWRDVLLVEVVEPQLGHPAPTIVCDYPASQAALARIRPGPPDVAERFELYVDGIELANGYHELLDAGELRCRQTEANRRRQADGKPALPEENRLLAAMEHGLPPCCGVALGFDRLVMIAAGLSQIDAVLAFPVERA